MNQVAPAYDKKVVKAWYMYDWANSVYPLVINSTIFPIYYEAVTTTVRDGQKINEQVNFLGMEFNNMTLYSYALSFSYLVVAVMMPLLSGVADYTGRKKFFLKIFCYTGAASCLLFTTFSRNHLEWGMLLVMLASIGFSGGLVFYNAFLPEIAPPHQHDRISAKGFAYGYTGSVILLIFNLVLISFSDVLGLPEGTPVLISFATVGIWWAGFAQVTFSGVPEQSTGKRTHRDVFTRGYRELRKVLGEVKLNTVLTRYLLAFFVFNMAVQTVMILAATFAVKEVRQFTDQGTTEPMSGNKLIISILLIQLLAIPGAYFFSWLSGKSGNLKALQTVLVVWIAACTGAFFVHYDYEFFVVAAIVGLVMGGIQSMSRSTYSKLLPETADHASYFSFYDVSDKLGIVLGTFIYGYIADLTGSMRNCILALVIFFIVGLLLLVRVPAVSALQPLKAGKN